MNPSTGTFITMDEYAGSIFEPVSLHKYLYANANPVMYSDPSGYSSLSNMVAATIISGVISGIITGYIRVKTFLSQGGQWEDINWSTVLIEAFGGACIGAVFGMSGWYAQFVKSAVIMTALGFSSLTFAGLAAIQAQAYDRQNQQELADIYWMLYVLGIVGGASSLNQAYKFQTANSTAATTTNNSVSNTSKADTLSQKQNFKSNISKNQTLKENCEGHIFTDKHIKSGIMDLGENKSIIMDSALSIIQDINDNNLLPEGPFQIKTHINGYKAEVRTYVKNGELINFDIFKGWSNRNFSNNIYW